MYRLLTYQKKLRSSGIPPGRLIAGQIVAVTLLAILSLTGTAQNTEELLDSAIRYERLKVAYKDLDAANGLQKKYSRSLEMSLHDCQLGTDSLQKAHIEAIGDIRKEERKKRRRANIKAFGIGAATAVVVRVVLKIVARSP